MLNTDAHTSIPKDVIIQIHMQSIDSYDDPGSAKISFKMTSQKRMNIIFFQSEAIF